MDSRHGTWGIFICKVSMGFTAQTADFALQRFRQMARGEICAAETTLFKDVRDGACYYWLGYCQAFIPHRNPHE
jgi:hypothetical protein